MNTIIVVMPTLGAAEASQALDAWFARERDPRFAPRLYVDHKFDAQKRLPVRNIRSLSPHLEQIWNVAVAAGPDYRSIFRDAYDALCLEHAVLNEPASEGLALWRRAPAEADISDLLKAVGSPPQAHSMINRDLLLFDRKNTSTSLAILTLASLYRSGGISGQSAPTFPVAMQEVQKACLNLQKDSASKIAPLLLPTDT